MRSSTPFKLTLTAGLTGALLLACGCSDEPTVASSESAAIEYTCTAPHVGRGGLRPYFAPFDSVEKEVLCVLDLAQQELVVAHYNIRRESYLNKLVELSDRGVDVKVVVDEGNAAKDYNTGDDFLEEHGIDLVRTRVSSRALMHLKVAVIDSDYAMTGSFNWNGTAALANDENMVVFREPEIVARYRDQALEVWGEGPRVVQPGDDTDELKLRFAPETHLDDVLVEEIATAESTIDIAMFTFTSTTVQDALIDALSRGVAVRAVIERKQTNRTTVHERLAEAGGQVILGANKVGQFSAMHQKYAIIDDERVITGATNWTYSGTRRNDEDMLIIRRPQVADEYRHNFADLLLIYGSIEDPNVADRAEAPGLFNVIHDGTEYGDRIVVTGNHPALGNWDPWAGVELSTSTSLYPSWTGRARLPAGMMLEYKYVTLPATGGVSWEQGPNRVLAVPQSGRAFVISGPFGDTSTNTTPADGAD